MTSPPLPPTSSGSDVALPADAARYRAVFEASPLPMWVYDVETMRFLAVNPAAVQLYGYSREEFLDRLTLADIRPPEGASAVLAEVSRPDHQNGCRFRRHRRKDGTEMDVVIISNDLTTEGGRPTRLVMVNDVSERTAAERALQLRERHLAGLVETQRELLRAPSARESVPRVLEILGRCADAARACYYEVGYEPAPDGRFYSALQEEWHAPGIRSMWDDPATSARVHPAGYVFFQAWIGQLRRGEIVILTAHPDLGEPESRYLAVRGMRSVLYAPLLVRGRVTAVICFHYLDEPHALLRGEHNPLLVAAGALGQAFEREQSARELAAETQRLGVTLSALAEGVITTDADGRIVLLNRAAEALAGCRADAAVGRPLREVFRTFAAAEGGAPHASPLGLGGEPEPAPRSEGRERVWLEAGERGPRRLIDKVAIPLRDDARRFVGVVRVFRDVTDEERLAAERRKASKLESLGILAGGLAHDFNNILTAILGNVSLAREDCAGTRADGNLEEAERACLQARDLTNQLRTFARGGAPLKKPVHLPGIIREGLGSALHEVPVRAGYRFPADLWPVEADGGQLAQVFHNLGLNAVQAMGAGGGTLAVRAENLVLEANGPLALPGGRYVRISVQDDGGGIPPEHLEKIFDPFFSTKPGGSGLGLATSYSIARRHGGHLGVDSVPGVGSTFHLLLPAAAAADAGTRGRGDAGTGGKRSMDLPSAPALSPLSPLRVSASSPLRVLVLDDEPAVRNLLGDMIGHLGAEVVTTAEGAETLAAYRQARDGGRPFDLLILDLTVPGGLGGREVMAALRAEAPGVHAVVSSGYAHDPVASQHAEHGFAGVLSKPYRLGELAAVLAAVRG